MRHSIAMHGLRTAVVAAALLALGGCLEARGDLVLEPDGTGTWRETSTVHMDKARAYCEVLIGEFRELEGGDEERASVEDALPDLDVRKRQAALARQRGIEVTRAVATSDEKKNTHTTELAVRFSSLRALFASGAVEDATATLVRTKEERHWKLTIRHAHLEGDVAPEALREVRAALLERFKPYWGGLAIQTTLTLPTRVVATNGVRTGPKTVTWSIGLADLADPRKLVQEVTFEHAENLELAPFGAAEAAAGDDK